MPRISPYIYIPIVLGVLFVISMINVIIYTRRQRRRWKNRQNTISSEGYMKLYLRIESGRGEIFVESVDKLPPLHTNEVIHKAILLLPGEHRIRFSARARDNSLAENVLPYQRNLGPYEVTIAARKDGIAALCLNVETQNIMIKEGEGQ